MPTSPPTGREANLDALEDLRQALNALGEVDLTLTLRAERLSDEQYRGVLQCILRDHLGKAIVELKDLAKELAAPRRPRHPRRPRPSGGRLLHRPPALATRSRTRASAGPRHHRQHPPRPDNRQDPPSRDPRARPRPHPGSDRARGPRPFRAPSSLGRRRRPGQQDRLPGRRRAAPAHHRSRPPPSDNLSPGSVVLSTANGAEIAPLATSCFHVLNF